jgi:hypothetical protein
MGRIKEDVLYDHYQKHREMGKVNKGIYEDFDRFLSLILPHPDREENGVLRWGQQGGLKYDPSSRLFSDFTYVDEKTGRNFFGLAFKFLQHPHELKEFSDGCTEDEAKAWLQEQGFIKGLDSTKSDYVYTDADGNPKYRTVVIRYADKRRRKQIWQEVWYAPGKDWQRSRRDQHYDKFLYRLPEVNQAVAAENRVYITEGKKMRGYCIWAWRVCHNQCRWRWQME